MAESLSNMNDTDVSAKISKRRPGTRFVLGAVLWLLCFGSLIFGWYQLRQKSLLSKNDAGAVEDEDDTGRSTKQIKLVPQKDGSFAAQEVTDESKYDPWDADGIEDFSFTDTNGQTLTKKDLLGKPFVIAFVFTMCRGPCPNVTKEMRELQNRLKGYDFSLVTLTVDPERDTIDVLKGYGKAEGANFDKWKFLTGDQKDIYGLIQRSFKMPVEEAKGDAKKPGFEIIHSTNIMLVNAEGRVVGKFNAMREADMDRLRKELKAIAAPVGDATKAERLKENE